MRRRATLASCWRLSSSFFRRDTMRCDAPEIGDSFPLFLSSLNFNPSLASASKPSRHIFSICVPSKKFEEYYSFCIVQSFAVFCKMQSRIFCCIHGRSDALGQGSLQLDYLSAKCCYCDRTQMRHIHRKNFVVLSLQKYSYGVVQIHVYMNIVLKFGTI